MPQPSAICIAIDRLHVGMLGAYGNSWIHTPALDRLASESLLLDQAIIDSPDLRLLYRSYWQGHHASVPDASIDAPPLPQLLREQGLHTALITDDPQVADHPLSAGFGERLVVEEKISKTSTDTSLERLFARAAQWLEQQDGAFFCWIHSRGLAGAWDAPLELRNQYADPEDPIPPDIRQPPSRRLSEDADPDELLGIVHAYAGQVTLLDSCIGALLELVGEHPLAKEALVIFFSARGYPLGEHGRLGPIDDALYSELVHVPMLLRLPDRAAALTRAPQLVQPADLFATLSNWHQVEGPRSPAAWSLLPLAEGDNTAARQVAFAIAQHERALRTGAWHARLTKHEDREQLELFVKPDDRWEANEVASHCVDAAESARTLLDELGVAFDASNPPPLVDVLTNQAE